MELTRCSRGHFYDAERFDSCPYCNGAREEEFTETVPYDEVEVTECHPPITGTTGDSLKDKIQSVTAENPDQDKTVGFYAKSIGTEPVVGWLVCIEGNHFGEDFRLTGGRNFIGRALDMDVALTGDNSVSREKHAVILYEPKENVFMIQPGDSKELCYLNDKVILQAELIRAYDILALGETKLMFIPFCSETFKWEETKKEHTEE